MNLGRLARGRRVLVGFLGAAVVQVAAVAVDGKILKEASKATLMPSPWQWSRTQDAPPLLCSPPASVAGGSRWRRTPSVSTC
ncbi:hypothetical protein OHA18_36970 [Kribbella sp. NBC_00709]|uniref:hypothetical protein n=1 Tax=Kribbella sp. NBC_00709 TaxID=2975972 RepID=UPI002E2B5D14|nr:hypothetical protein [Kribbella sp. NBC_00709]